MTPSELLADAFGRIRDGVHAVVDGAAEDLFTRQAGERSNTIAWLVWHLTRVQDDHVADAAGSPQIWTHRGWSGRFGLPLDEHDTGYGHSPEQVGAVRAHPELLLGYHDAVADRTLEYVGGLGSGDLDRIVDVRWDPPVTLGVRLVSVVADDLQHVGQAAFLRGLLAPS